MKRILFYISSIALLIACDRAPETSIVQDLQAPQVVGGKPVEELTDAASSTVLLWLTDGANGSAICTGTLIAKDLILTAAHCADPRFKMTLVGFGKNVEESFKDLTKNPAGIVTGMKIDPLYDASKPGENSVHDIAIFKFIGKIPEGYKIRALPAKDYAFSPNEKFQLIGFGRTQDNEEGSAVLHNQWIPSSDTIPSLYDEETKMDYVLPGNIAIAQPNGGICNGDSGGPLFVQSPEGALTLLGVAAKGGNLKDPNLPCHGYALFVDIRAQLDWINATITDLQ